MFNYFPDQRNVNLKVKNVRIKKNLLFGPMLIGGFFEYVHYGCDQRANAKKHYVLKIKMRDKKYFKWYFQISSSIAVLFNWCRKVHSQRIKDNNDPMKELSLIALFLNRKCTNWYCDIISFVQLLCRL